jgi:hypothetical protein
MTRAGRVAIAALLVLGAGGCRRKAPTFARLPEPATTFELSVHRDAKDAGGSTPGGAPLLIEQKLSPELRKLVDEAHAHPAVGSLEAAGCEQALVMKGAAYSRFVDLRHGKKMPAQADDARTDVVWCQSRTTAPPDCAALAPIFARVARPGRSFQLFSGTVDPPFSPRCAGVHDAGGRFVSGEGPGYPPSR